MSNELQKPCENWYSIGIESVVTIIYIILLQIPFPIYRMMLNKLINFQVVLLPQIKNEEKSAQCGRQTEILKCIHKNSENFLRFYHINFHMHDGRIQKMIFASISEKVCSFFKNWFKKVLPIEFWKDNTNFRLLPSPVYSLDRWTACYDVLPTDPDTISTILYAIFSLLPTYYICIDTCTYIHI